MTSASNRDWDRDLQSLQGLDISGDIPFQDALGVVRGGLQQQLEKLQAEGGFIFSLKGDTEELTEETIACLRQWHMDMTPPTLTALCIYTVETLRLKCPPEMLKAMLVASVLGEVDNTLPYHNNLHYRKVLLQVMRMIAVHNDIYQGTARVLSDEECVLLLIAACIHDFGHDGKGNTVKGVFEPGRLEQRSYDLSRPYFEAVGFDDEQMLGALRVMILCTEVTPLGDPANPMSQMKAAYRYHFLGHKSQVPALNLDEDLKALETSPALTMMSLILHEADIATSAGLDYEVTKYETVVLLDEIGDNDPTPQVVLEFLNQVCQRQMLSSAGQELYGANMARIYALAEEDVRRGNQEFPKAEFTGFLQGYQSDRSSDGKTIN